MASSGASIGALFFSAVEPSLLPSALLPSPLLTPAQEPRHLVERPLRRRQADSLHALRELFEALERQREMSAALGRHERVNLVDDHRVDRAQRFPRVRREEQVDRFGRRDEDVGGIALKAGPLDRGRIPGADGNGRHPVRVAARRRAVGDAGQRRPQVTFDVDGEAFSGDRYSTRQPARSVGAAAGSNMRRLMHHRNAVERLAAAGRREDEGRFSARDCRPAQRLRRSWRCKRRAEPVRDRRMK